MEKMKMLSAVLLLTTGAGCGIGAQEPSSEMAFLVDTEGSNEESVGSGLSASDQWKDSILYQSDDAQWTYIAPGKKPVVKRLAPKTLFGWMVVGKGTYRQALGTGLPCDPRWRLVPTSTGSVLTLNSQAGCEFDVDKDNYQGPDASKVFGHYKIIIDKAGLVRTSSGANFGAYYRVFRNGVLLSSVEFTFSGKSTALPTPPKSPKK